MNGAYKVPQEFHSRHKLPWKGCLKLERLTTITLGWKRVSLLIYPHNKLHDIGQSTLCSQASQAAGEWFVCRCPLSPLPELAFRFSSLRRIRGASGQPISRNQFFQGHFSETILSAAILTFRSNSLKKNHPELDQAIKGSVQLSWSTAWSTVQGYSSLFCNKKTADLS